MISLKPGSRVAGLRPEIVLALIAADQIYALHGAALVVTEATGGKHGAGSLHYVGLAVDLRTRDVPPGELSKIVEELRASLGPEFDVVLESDHVHVEFQPKTGGSSA